MVAFMLAALVPGIEKLFAIFGAVGGSLVVYVFPSIFFLATAKRLNLLGPSRPAGELDTGVTNSDGERQPLLAVTDMDVPPAVVMAPEQVMERPSKLTVAAAYANVGVGLFLFVVGSLYSFIDLFMKD
jgi:hypothetical protein